MKEILAEYPDKIKTYLNHLLEEKGNSYGRINRWGKDVAERLKKFSTIGKMIRGSLVLFTQEMYGKKNNDESLKAAAAIELFHSGLLIHDDIIDRDELRRGNPAVHYQYNKLGVDESLNNPQQFGISMGICAGDIAFFIGFELLSTLNIKHSTKDKLLQLFSKEFTSVGLGQMQDIFFAESGQDPKEEDILKLYLHKTARYTFSLPFMLGGLISDIREQEITYLEKLGELLGLIFQIRDDELGLFGEVIDFGKPIGSDIEERKKTLFYLYLFKLAAEDEKNRLLTVFGSHNISADSVKYVQDLIIKYNIKQIIHGRMLEYKRNAEKVISEMDIDGNYRNILHNIIDFNLNRTK